MIQNKCALVMLKSLPDNSQDLIFGDAPYLLGSTVKIGKDGKPYYEKARDFMNAWDGKQVDEKFWEEFFFEANRVLKFGGRILFFGIDRQLFLFQYYAVAAGFEIKQSLYWYFISNFPKATDLSKQIDKRLGVDREQVVNPLAKQQTSQKSVSTFDKRGVDFISPNAATELGKKYDGYKYSLSPLKQVLETVMVFQKRTKNKSILDDVFAFENGDKTISPSIWAIDSGRVGTTGARFNGRNVDSNIYGKMGTNKKPEIYDYGRYPSQMFIDKECASKIDEQSGELTSGKHKEERSEIEQKNTYGKSRMSGNGGYNDSGGASRILHHIGYLDEELDLVFYSPKVSTFEREFGVKNNHPCLKPIKLIYQIAKLLKAPFPQRVFFPFSGAGSEIIGFEQAGFDKELFSMSELDTEFVAIAEARRKAWRELDIENLDENKKHIEKRNEEHPNQGSLF